MPTCVVISLRQCVDATINQINVKEYDYILSRRRGYGLSIGRIHKAVARHEIPAGRVKGVLGGQSRADHRGVLY
jgi:hypothetical protein